jgi:hypothetical protein
VSRAIKHHSFLAAAALGTALSMALTGYVTGLWNNLFHLPILAGLPDLPQFAHDPFIQSLPHYASGFWLMLAGTAPGDNAFPLLAAFAVASRFLTMVGFLACADAIGIRDLPGRMVFAVLIAFSSMANGYAAAGAGGLFISYFTHSELANATILLAIWGAARGRFTAAMAFEGATCFLNAFMGAWNAVPLILIAALLLARREISWQTMLRRIIIGIAPFALFTAPVIHVILSNPSFGRPADFDFVRFLSEFFPDHFLVGELKPKTLIALAIVTLTGGTAAFTLARREPRAAFCVVALAGFVILWLAGTILPLLTHRPVLLSLHLLRASVGIHLFGALAGAALTVLWTQSGDRIDSRVRAPLMAIAMDSSRFLLPLAILIPFVRRLDPPRLIARLRPDIAAAILLIAAIWPAQIVMQARINAGMRSNVAIWRALGRWAKAHTAANAVFLIPIANVRNPPAEPIQDSSQPPLSAGYEVFETFAERRIWIDAAGGGAVMWTPAYHPIWHRRLMEVLALQDHGARMAYARARAIDYVIDGCGSDRALARFSGRCVYRAEP